MANMLIAHGGAPTAVINASLYGAVMTAKKHGVGHIYGALYGSAGILKEAFADLSALPQSELEKLLYTPASAIGTSRTALTAEDYRRIASVLQKHDIRYVLFTGGNGSMDTCGKLKTACEGMDICIAGIPKTIDNDIAVIDHAPGYASAASFVTRCVSEIAQDVRAMPIHVCIVEIMGRNAGWLAAAAGLAGTRDGAAADLIYMPERPFEEERFLADVQRLHREKGGVLVAVSEGLKKADGTTVAPPLFVRERSRYDGEVGFYLAKLVIEKLGVKARSEKPGIWGRCCGFCQSSVDREEAVQMGALAARAVLEEKSGVMAGLERISSRPYACREVLVPIEQVMLSEQLMPDDYINAEGNGITDAFRTWCEPLIEAGVPEYIDLKPVSGCVEDKKIRS